MQYNFKTIFLLILLLANLAVPRLFSDIVLSQQSASIKTSGGLSGNGMSVSCKNKLFNGMVTVRNDGMRDAEISVVMNEGYRSMCYTKTVRIPSGKSSRFPVFGPVFRDQYGYGYYNVIMRESGSPDDIRWTDLSSYPSTPEEVTIYQPVKLDELQEDFRFYTNITTLSLTLEQWAKLSKEQKEAILDWVSIGGNLNLDSADPKAKDELKGPVFSDEEGKGMDLYGMGRITLENAPTHGQENALTKMLLERDFKVAPSWEVKKAMPEVLIPAVILFSLLIGPGAVWWCIRKKRPVLMIVVIPVISLFSCGLIFLISLLREGITPKACLQTLSFLDQPSGKVFVSGILGIEAPLGLGSPVELPERAIIFLPQSKSPGLCVADNGKLSISKCVLPRIPAFFGTIKLEKCREKLDVEEGAGGIKVTNGLKAPLKSLLLRDGRGEYWKADAEIDPGKAVTLRKLSKDEKLPDEFAGYDTTLMDGLSRKPAKLANSCYQAELASNVFGDEGIGSKRMVGDNFHLLIGRYR